MAALYIDEDFPIPVANLLAAMGHDVLAVEDDDPPMKGAKDPDVLLRAIALGRCVVTHNRDDFRKLHGLYTAHFGIVIATRDADESGLAQRISEAVMKASDLRGQLIKVYRPS